MKKHYRLSALILALLLALTLSGCGAAKSATPNAAMYDVAPAEPAAAYAAEMATSQEAYDMAADDNGGIANRDAAAEDGADLNAEKIIYSADAEIETIDYDAAIQGVYDMVARLGGFMESTSVSGSDYYDTARGNASLRRASFVIRVPSENFAVMTGSLSELGNVPSCSTYSQNVTRQYYDVESRLNAYKTQETRLLEMLAIAETVEDMLAIQAQLTEVQYQIDSYTSTLKNLDNQVGYSTVSLTLREVREYTPEPTVTLSYWQKLGVGFQRSLASVGRFFTNAFLWLASNLPMILLVCALLLAAFLLLRRIIRRMPQMAQRRADRRAKRAEKRAARKANKARPQDVEPKE